jgi:6-phosphogluconolactonase
MDVELVVVPHADGAARAAALLVAVARADGSIALAGGSTPRRAYELAAALEPDWRGAELWLGDERCVRLTDEHSNARLVREALLDRLAAPPPAAHFVDTELPPEAAAAAYDEALRGAALDLCLLGLGPDGHTASLFPGSPALEAHDRLAVAADPGLAPWVPRVTMTIPMLSSAAHVVFLAVGADKAAAARRAFAEASSPLIPASLVRAAAGRTTAILDEAAAAGIVRSS